MSVVTDIILCCSLGEEMGDDKFPAVERVNAYLEAENRGKLNHLNRHAGGFKAWQSDVFGGAFNYLDIEGFMKAVNDAGWQEPERVQILIKGEHDVVFGLVNLVAPLVSRMAGYEARAARQALGRDAEDEQWI